MRPEGPCPVCGLPDSESRAVPAAGLRLCRGCGHVVGAGPVPPEGGAEEAAERSRGDGRAWAADPEAIRQLAAACRGRGAVGPLGWNLAALAETQPWTLPLLCRRTEPGRYVVRRSAAGPVAVAARDEDGSEVPLLRWGGLDGQGRPPTLWGLPTIVQLGLGSGALAGALAERAGPRQHLFVWEADPALARAVLEAVDLSHLWLSAQVSLLLGERPDLPPDRRRRLGAPAQVIATDSARRWNTWIYRTILAGLNPASPPVQALVARRRLGLAAHAPAVPGRRRHLGAAGGLASPARRCSGPCRCRR
jgi:hypothetical protein